MVIPYVSNSFAIIALIVLLLISLLQLIKYVIKLYFKTEALIVKLLHSSPKDTGFKYVFALNENAKDITYDKASSTVTLQYTIPESICMHTATGISNADEHDRGIPENSFQLGAAIALADEVTSIVLGAVDKCHRFGVSVQLSGESCGNADLHPVVAGTVAHLVVKIIKIGKTLSTLEMDIFVPGKVASNTLCKVFTIRHIKYVEMGPIWNVLGGLLPAVLHFGRAQSRRPAGSPAAGAEADPSVGRLLALTAQSPTLFASASAPAVAGSGSSPRDDPRLVVDNVVLGERIKTVDATHYSMHVHKHVENFFGSMHGGALACAFQCVVLEFCKTLQSQMSSPGRPASFQVASLEISYLRPSKKSLTFVVEITSTSSFLFQKPKLAELRGCSDSDRCGSTNASDNGIDGGQAPASFMQLSVSSFTSKRAGSREGKLAASAVCKLVWFA